MKFGGTFYNNFSNANGSKSKDYAKDVLLDEIARLIEFDKAGIILILKDSGFKLPSNATKKQVIDATVRALYNRPQFRVDITKLIINSNEADFSNGNGSAGGAGAGATGGSGGNNAEVVGAIAGALGSLFSFGKASKDKKAEEEKTRQELIQKLITDEEKTDFVPIIVLGSIFLIGAIGLIVVLKSNTAKA